MENVQCKIFSFLIDEVERKCSKDESSSVLWVLWNDAKIAEYIHSRIKKSLLEYTVEISPPTEASIQSFLFHQVPDFSKFSSRYNTIKIIQFDESKTFFPTFKVPVLHIVAKILTLDL